MVMLRSCRYQEGGEESVRVTMEEIGGGFQWLIWPITVHHIVTYMHVRLTESVTLN